MLRQVPLTVLPMTLLLTAYLLNSRGTKGHIKRTVLEPSKLRTVDGT